MLTKDNQLSQLEEQLYQANKQLLQSEKLAAIGQLAAGVAHEINNPVGYVHSNLQSLEGYLVDLFGLVDSMDKVDSIDALRAKRDACDYGFLKTDIQDLLGESLEGVDRIEKIISSLKDFAHTDDEEFKPADLHRGIESTLNVVGNELKYRAKVYRDFGELPLIDCIMSQVNQVVMNLLVNAAHAIENFGRIDIRTGVAGEEVWFEVEDDGSGIDPANLEHLFEPFYTTKPVGKGTGLGLALSKNITDKHGGRIEVFSELDKGTRFRVWLPISQAQAPTDGQ